jgi:hypothetical protein
MDGVIILNSFQAQVGSTWGFSCVGLAVMLFSIGLSFLILYCARNLKQRDSIFCVIFGIIITIICGVYTFIGCCSEAKPIYETQYRVLVNDTTSINEFLRHYEILTQDGLVLVVRER